MSVNYLLVDDQTEDAGRLAGLLSSEGLCVHTVPPEPDLAFVGDVLQEAPVDGLILDYKLSYSDTAVKYDCPALAGHCRENWPELPIIVLSGVVPAEPSVGASYSRTRRLYDWYLDKSELGEREGAENARAVMLSLANGYSQISAFLGALAGRGVDDEAFTALLGLSADVSGVTSWVRTESEGQIFRMAQCILDLLNLPGPLLPLRESTVFLGVHPDSATELKPALEPARYVGPFSGVYAERRFWAELLTSCDVPSGLPAPVCEASGRQADTVCEDCAGTFSSFFTLGVERVGAPGIAQAGRVCGFCLRKGLATGLRIPAGSRPLVASVIAETGSAQNRLAYGNEAETG